MPITIFTDGSSRGNPGPGGWGAVVRTQSEVRELGGREDHTTNNRMELSAAINALIYVDESIDDSEIVLQTDSKYLINGITQWVKGWERNGWKTTAKKDVENRDLWEALSFASKGLSIDWRYVQGHAGHPGNERCDEIATGFADKADVALYHGPKDGYTIDLDAEPSPTTGASKKKPSSSAKAYSYLSLVDGAFMVHKTWAECEARVKGVRGARFKKSVSPEDERRIKKEWGV
ncbi:MAG: ribonuclease HI [Candidatus Taylorbacteria bacterium]|nr:ribonuclease HI [Candidatus Taylorbacteria bacterium]